MPRRTKRVPWVRLWVRGCKAQCSTYAELGLAHCKQTCLAYLHPVLVHCELHELIIVIVALVSLITGVVYNLQRILSTLLALYSLTYYAYVVVSNPFNLAKRAGTEIGAILDKAILLVKAYVQRTDVCFRCSQAQTITDQSQSLWIGCLTGIPLANASIVGDATIRAIYQEAIEQPYTFVDCTLLATFGMRAQIPSYYTIFEVIFHVLVAKVYIKPKELWSYIYDGLVAVLLGQVIYQLLLENLLPDQHHLSTAINSSRAS